MDVSRISSAGLAATALLFSVGLVGCGSDKSTTAASTSAAPVTSSATAGAAPKSMYQDSPAEASPSDSEPSEEQSVDFSTLLIPASDLGPSVTASGPAPLPDNTPGVSQVYSSTQNGRRIIDMIVVFPDAAAADSNFVSNSATTSEVVTGTPQPAQVGDKGTVVAGKSPDGSKDVTLVMFSQGKALVHMTFESPSGDAADPDTVLEIAKQQADAVKNGLS
jgi:hypothetical protein